MNQIKLRCSSYMLLLLLFSLCLPYKAAAYLSSERRALLAFSAAIHHGNKLNWRLGTPTCSSWIGVTCTADGTRVVAVRLPGIRLLGNIPKNTLGRLGALQVLSLRSNELTGTLPSDVASLPSLRFLFLQHNNFSGHVPSSLSSSLNTIDLSSNGFSGEIPAGISNLSRLITLNLENNFLSGPIPDLRLPRLKHLNVSSNNLNGSVPFSLQRFPKISFIGNLQLCGPPLPQCPALLPSPSPTSPLPPLPSLPLEHKKSSSKRFTAGAIVAILVGVLALFFLIVITLLLCIFKRKIDSPMKRQRERFQVLEEVRNLKKNTAVEFKGEQNKLFFSTVVPITLTWRTF
ncbi:hypothetical protein HPP92_001643 [Vanilla planifolia]|uniref:Leucine-rich repeat-containing N-terminal plant-type domain-containing protein n=1 Tax=Vanilla planifolia TaxID=51239 RepID=A0A835S4M6_VANPL|nr:hypothetical protein HPP92_001643 [Vanilla planifolia]